MANASICVAVSANDHLCTATTCVLEIVDDSVVRCASTGRLHACGVNVCQALIVRGANVICPITERVICLVPQETAARANRALARPLKAFVAKSLVPTPTSADVITQTTMALLAGPARVVVAREEYLRVCGAAIYTLREVLAVSHPLAGMVHAICLTVHIMNGSPAGVVANFHSSSPGCALRGMLIPNPFEACVHEPFAARVNRWLCQYFALAWARFQRCRAPVVAWIKTNQAILSKSDSENLLHKIDMQQFVVQMCLLSRNGIVSRYGGRFLVSRLPWLIVFGPTYVQTNKLCDPSKRHTKMQLRAALNAMDTLHNGNILSLDPCLAWPVVFNVQTSFCKPETLARTTADAEFIKRTLFLGDLFREPQAVLHEALGSIKRPKPPSPPAFVALYWQEETKTHRIRATYMPRMWQSNSWRLTTIYGPYVTLEAAERAVLAYNAVQSDKRGDSVFQTGNHSQARAVKVWR